MKWLRGALYALPLLVAGLWLLGHLVLSVLGADCQGDLLDGGGLRCNELGEVQWDAFFIGWRLAPISLAIWALWLLANAVNALLSRHRTKEI